MFWSGKWDTLEYTHANISVECSPGRERNCDTDYRAMNKIVHFVLKNGIGHQIYTHLYSLRLPLS